MDINLKKLTKTEKIQIREQKLKQIEQEKLKIYGLKKTHDETEILEKALMELTVQNKTDIVCPRCGNKLILLEKGASGKVQCLNDEICIEIGYRGL